MASLPSLQASLEVATGADGVIEGSRVKRYVDLSTVGSHMAVQIQTCSPSATSSQLDSPVSGGVGGAEKGTLAVMVSGPRDEFESGTQPRSTDRPALLCRREARLGADDEAGQQYPVGHRHGRDCEAVVIGVKAGLDAGVMIDVINAGSGMNTASRDKFPRAILPRSFDFGFATGLMVKDVRLELEEAKALGMSMEVAEAVGRLWEPWRDEGPDSDFTSVIKPLEKAAGVTVGRAVAKNPRAICRPRRDRRRRRRKKVGECYYTYRRRHLPKML